VPSQEERLPAGSGTTSALQTNQERITLVGVELVTAEAYYAGLMMPPLGFLSEEAKGNIRQWIQALGTAPRPPYKRP